MTCRDTLKKYYILLIHMQHNLRLQMYTMQVYYATLQLGAAPSSFRDACTQHACTQLVFKGFGLHHHQYSDGHFIIDFITN